jgi:hypothetical protein
MKRISQQLKTSHGEKLNRIQAIQLLLLPEQESIDQKTIVRATTQIQMKTKASTQSLPSLETLMPKLRKKTRVRNTLLLNHLPEQELIDQKTIVKAITRILLITKASILSLPT